MIFCSHNILSCSINILFCSLNILSSSLNILFWRPSSVCPSVYRWLRIKLGHHSPWVVSFKYCVNQVHITSIMSSSGKHSLTLDPMRNIFKDLFLRTTDAKIIYWGKKIICWGNKIIYWWNKIICCGNKISFWWEPSSGKHSLTLDPMGNIFKDLFLRNYSVNWK
jgi:hypothetical protein